MNERYERQLKKGILEILASFTRKDVRLSDDYVYERKKSWYV